jgi:hypothetical protein
MRGKLHPAAVRRSNMRMHPTRDTNLLMYNRGAGGRVMRALDRLNAAG